MLGGKTVIKRPKPSSVAGSGDGGVPPPPLEGEGRGPCREGVFYRFLQFLLPGPCREGVSKHFYIF